MHFKQRSIQPNPSPKDAYPEVREWLMAEGAWLNSEEKGLVRAVGNQHRREVPRVEGTKVQEDSEEG